MMEQKKLLEMRMLEKQFAQTEQNLNAVEQEIMTLQNIKLNLDKVKKNEVLANLDRNIFVPAKISDEKFFIGVGSGVVVKKDRKGAEETIEKQIGEMSRIKKEMEKESERIIKRFRGMEDEKDNRAH